MEGSFRRINDKREHHVDFIPRDVDGHSAEKHIYQLLHFQIAVDLHRKNNEKGRVSPQKIEYLQDRKNIQVKMGTMRQHMNHTIGHVKGFFLCKKDHSKSNDITYSQLGGGWSVSTRTKKKRYTIPI